MRVLVVEDDSSIRETITIVLEAYQHSADVVDTAEGVLEYLGKQWPDVMLLDLTLQGTTGEEVYQMIQSRYGRVPPTVVLSAVQGGEKRARSLQGAWFLGKPYSIEQLAEIIEQAAGTRGVA